MIKGYIEKIIVKLASEAVGIDERVRAKHALVQKAVKFRCRPLFRPVLQLVVCSGFPSSTDICAHFAEMWSRVSTQIRPFVFYM